MATKQHREEAPRIVLDTPWGGYTPGRALRVLVGRWDAIEPATIDARKADSLVTAGIAHRPELVTEEAEATSTAETKAPVKPRRTRKQKR